MAIELPRVLKNMNLFVDGRGYAGRIDEIQLPKLTLKAEEHRAGGMDLPETICRHPGLPRLRSSRVSVCKD